MKSVKVLSIPIHATSKAEAISKIAGFIASKKPHQVTTVNNEFVLEAQSNGDFLKILQSADLSLADSTGVVWAARRQGAQLERIPGADLVNELAKQGWSMYLVGGADGVAEKAAQTLTKTYDTKIVGAEVGLRPGDNPEKTEALIKRINTAKPDVLLVAFGAPKQDLFIFEHKAELNVPVMIGVGGTLDFLAGKVSRAPQFIRSIGLEWLWRLIQQPSRLPRIWRALIIFPFRVLIVKN
jgi:N-acetylglucosaminyldiphosphoundecaprenol N-acetyl-beta-D-mannosaminyltransferase